MEDEEKLKKILDEIKKRTAVPAYFASLDFKKPSIFQSKVGGKIGYLPKDGKIPTDSKGNQLRLLAQINCRDVDLEEFPKEGILQFWILNDDCLGMNFDEPAKQDTFRVIYHEQIDKSVRAEDILAQVVENTYDEKSYFPAEEDDYFPVQGECGLVFRKSTDYMKDYDYRFDNLFKKIYLELGFEESEFDDFREIFYDYMYDKDYDNDEIYGDNDDYETHKIGGYPYFTQEDPRGYKEGGDNYDYLLFQLNTDDCSEDGDESPVEIMWGDCGVGNFFINKQKLINKDFSDVLYNWDCC